MSDKLDCIGTEYLRELFLYEPSTGWLIRRVSKGASKAGSLAGSNGGDYSRTSIDGEFYLTHRLIWKYHYGSVPPEIDHINGNTFDNRLENLRQCTHGQNMKNRKVNSNSKTGYKGVYFHKDTNKWAAMIQCDGRRKHLGVFETPEKAHKAYLKASESYHGQFARNQ